jgi:glycosyltransferase EpsF
VKTRVLHVVGTMNRGGAETFIMNILRNIDREKFEFYFLCFNDNKSDYDDEIAALGATVVHVSDVKKAGIVKHIGDIRKVIRNYQIDIVHAHTSYNMVFSLIAARLEGVCGRLSHSHSTGPKVPTTFTRKIYVLVSRSLINYTATARLACGVGAGETFYGDREYSIIHNGIDIKKFTYNKFKRDRIRKDLNIDKDTVVLIHVGRFFEVKNHAFLLDVFYEYQKINNNSRLILIGDGPLREAAEEKAKSLGIADSVSFMGLRTDTSELYNIADMFVMPSLYEGLPLVLIEAQANGLVCLVSDSIDKNAKLTKYIKFCSLSKNAKTWAEHIVKTSLLRTEGGEQLAGSAYDMTVGIKDIEKIYTDEVARL